jgi:hypothetical protein
MSSEQKTGKELKFPQQAAGNALAPGFNADLR